MEGDHDGLTVDFTEDVVVIIGGREGIGRAFALAFAKCGATVVVASRAVGDLELSATEKDGLVGEIHTATVDVTDPASINRLAAEVADLFSVPTVLVNSAGAHSSAAAFDVTPEEWDRVHHTQLRGVFFACQSFGRLMAARGYGKIINLSSTWAVTVADGRSVYAAAKAGVSQLTAALAVEWAPLGVRVNAIAPTATKTPAAQSRLDADPSREAAVASLIPLGRWAEPSDVVGSALFLGSRASDFITGQVLFVDGGWVPSKQTRTPTGGRQ